MIFVGEQFCCKFRISNIDDFILTEDFIELRYTETAGNVLPYFYLQFILRDLNILKYLNQGNILHVSVGRNSLELIDIPLLILDDVSQKNYTLGENIQIKGVLAITDYSLVDRVSIIGDSYSYEAINNVVSNHFTFKTNVSKSNDKMSWRQSNISNKAFVDEIWLHSYINTDTFIIAACDNNNFYFYDIKQKLLEKPKWIFSKYKSGNEKSGIINFGHNALRNRFGNYNMIAGYNYNEQEINIESGISSKINYKLKNFTTYESNKFNILSENNLLTNFSFTNSNVHSNYNLAYYQNLKNLAIYSSVKTYITFSGQFKQLSLLDIATIDEDSSNLRNAGINFITEITYQITNKRLFQNVVLCRESLNSIVGDLQS